MLGDVDKLLDCSLCDDGFGEGEQDPIGEPAGSIWNGSSSENYHIYVKTIFIYLVSFSISNIFLSNP